MKTNHTSRSIIACCLSFLAIPSVVGAAPEIDYAKHGPLQVLEILAETPTDWVSIGDAPKNWILKEHIPKLIEKLGSKQPCAGGHSMRDSRAVGIGGYGPGKKGRSTVGHEAAHMIESFRHGLYPKSHAFTIDWTTPDDDALRAWWWEFDRGGRKERENKPKPGTVDAGVDGMAREPRPGEEIEKTKLGDEEIKRLLVGTWMHEQKIGADYEVKQTHAFEKDGSYQMQWVNRIGKEKIESNEKGQWTVQGGVLTLTPTEPKGKEKSLYGRFTAYTIMKINDSEIEWQIDWERSDTSPAVKRSLTIDTHKRVK